MKQEVFDDPTVYKKYCVGDIKSTEYGFWHKDETIKVEIKMREGKTVKIVVNDQHYDSTISCCDIVEDLHAGN